MAIDIAEPTPSRRRRDALWARLISAVVGARSRGQQLWGALGQTVKFLVLLVLILAALASTTVLDRASQVLLLKVFLVAFLSLLPGWLYLQFIKVKGIGLYDEYVLNLYRLQIDDVVNLPKPPPGSRYWQQWFKAVKDAEVDPARNIYLKKFEAVYGRSAVPDSRRQREDAEVEVEVDQQAGHAKLFQRIQADAFSPVIMATAMLCVGWIVVVVPELYGGLRPFGDLTLSGVPRMPDEALRYGFIGSYAFIVQSLVRRYFQADLKTHAYVSAMARVILVSALITALHPLWTMQGVSQQTELAFAFLIGFFPELGLRALRQTLAGVMRALPIGTDERFPLRQLDGVTIWVQARFLEEGIEDMQNLATANLVDLMLHTRMPISRLVDWIDQAFLYLRVGNGNGRSSKTDQGTTDESGDRKLLRRYGIRTATDLLNAFDKTGTKDEKFDNALLRLLNHGPERRTASVMEGLRRTLEGEVNLWHVRQWKEHTWLTSQPCDADNQTANPHPPPPALPRNSEAA
jgi:hypothetical protein